MSRGIDTCTTSDQVGPLMTVHRVVDQARTNGIQMYTGAA